jgi:hypothetical protein
MSFTITRTLEQLPSYPVLGRLGGQNQIQITGNERAGSFSGRGVEGGYEFGEQGLDGTFASHGVTGEFHFQTGKAAVTVTDKPFWLPETFWKRKIMEGLDALAAELARIPLKTNEAED